MRTRAVTIALVLLLVVAGCTAGARSSGDQGQGTDTSVGAAPRPGPTGSDTPTPGESAPSPVPTVTGRSGGQSRGDGSELVPEATPSPSSLADLLPSDPPAAGRLPTPPADASAASGLAAGFPTGVLYVPEGASVLSSAVTTNSGRSQLALDATVPGPCSGLLADLRAWFTAGNFTEGADTRETPARADLTFTRDDGHVTVAAVTADDACRLTQSGVLAAGAGS
ncbi:hypothetical protein [Xylanimonas sp. McL0601]|uniref:hypothetical protein n=1 Tax=Xylanimonas sp. McL0601 TaxID=3414739 RepID=UPI003CE90DAC